MVSSAIILAAGEGTRLKLSKPKPVVDLGGFRLFQLPLISLRRIGIKKFYIVTQPRTYPYIERSLKRLRVNYRIIVNTEIHRENGYSLYLGLKKAKEEVLFVSMSDHVFPPELPQRLLDYWREDIDMLIAADRNPIYADIEEATKILADKDGNVVRISKRISSFNYIDAGVFLLKRKRILRVVESLVNDRDVLRASTIINEAVRKGFKVKIGDITGIPWLDVDTKEDLRKIISGEAQELIEKILGVARVMNL